MRQVYSDSSAYSFSLEDMIREYIGLKDGYLLMLLTARILFPERRDEAIFIWNYHEGRSLLQTNQSNHFGVFR